MENILRKVQNNVAKEFEVEKDVVPGLHRRMNSKILGRNERCSPGPCIHSEAVKVMNEALAENVFVGLLCIMNRIPLFIVGKPGHRFDQWFSIRRGKPSL